MMKLSRAQLRPFALSELQKQNYLCPLCGKPMRCGLLQSGGVLYFTDKEKYWINWPLRSRGDIPLLGGKLFPAFPDDGATKLAQICTDCEIVLFYYGKKWDDRRWNR